MSLGIGAPRRMPVAEVTGLYGLIALIQDPKACKHRLEELEATEKEANDAYDKAVKADADAQKTIKAAEDKALAAAKLMQDAEQRSQAADKAKTDAESDARIQRDRLREDRAQYDHDVRAFNDHVTSYENDMKTREAGLKQGWLELNKAKTDAEAMTKHAEEMLADAERRIALIRSAAA